jgi:hypothetical protein
MFVYFYWFLSQDAVTILVDESSIVISRISRFVYLQQLNLYVKVKYQHVLVVAAAVSILNHIPIFYFAVPIVLFNKLDAKTQCNQDIFFVLLS